MLSIKVKSSVALGILLCVATELFAAPQSSITLEVGSDNNSGRNHYLSGRYAFENGIRLKASSGESTNKDSNNKELKSTTRSLGIQSDPQRLINVGFDISNADQISTVNIDSTKLTIELNTYDWNFYIAPEFRQISAQSTTNINTNTHFDSNGVNVSVSYYGFDPFYITVSQQHYDYSLNLSALNNNINFFTDRFGSDTLNQVFALEDRRNSVELGYYFTNASIAVNHSRGRSVVDQSISTANTLYFNYKINSHWTLGANGGVSTLDTSSTTTKFGAVNLSYRW